MQQGSLIVEQDQWDFDADAPYEEDMYDDTGEGAGVEGDLDMEEDWTEHFNTPLLASSKLKETVIYDPRMVFVPHYSVEASLNNLVILFYSITSKFSNAFPFPQICSAGADAGLAIIHRPRKLDNKLCWKSNLTLIVFQSS